MHCRMAADRERGCEAVTTEAAKAARSMWRECIIAGAALGGGRGQGRTGKTPLEELTLMRLTSARRGGLLLLLTQLLPAG